MNAPLTHRFNAYAGSAAFIPYANYGGTGMTAQLAGCSNYAPYAVSSFEPKLEERITSFFSSLPGSRFVNTAPNAFMASATSSGQSHATPIKTPVAEPEAFVFGRPGNTEHAGPEEIAFWFSGNTEIPNSPLTIPADPAHPPTEDSHTETTQGTIKTGFLDGARDYLDGLRDAHNIKLGAILGLGLGIGICLGYAASFFTDIDSLESSKAVPQESYVEPKKPVEKPSTTSELDWSKTHVVVFNGDKQDQYYWNVMSAIKTAVEKKAAGLYVLGFREQLEGVRQYPADSSLIDYRDIKKAFRDVQINSAPGDTILIYIAGGAERDNAVRDEDEGKRIDHPFLAKALSYYLDKRNVVLVSEREMCPCFSGSLLDSNKFSSLVFMGPHAKENHKKEPIPSKKWDDSVYESREAPISFFWPFWYALRTNFDPNANGKATLEEAFYGGMEGYWRYLSNDRGLFRVSPTRLESLDNVQNAVVMVTDESSDDSKKMVPEFERANLFVEGNIRFYSLDIHNANNLPGIKSAPTTFVWKAGKIATIRRGYMDYNKITGWLADQPLAVTNMDTPMNNLYAQQDYASIVLMSTYDDLRQQLGSSESIRILISLLKHKDQGVSGNAAGLLGEASPYMSPSDIAELWKLSSHDNPTVRSNVANALENISENIKADEGERDR